MDTRNQRKYDLAKRTSKFGKDVILFCKSVTLDSVSRPVVSQIVRSATSVGANYMEAQGASSKKDFTNKLYICRKEIQETKHWLEMLATCFESRKPEIRELWKEAQELTLILSKSTSTARKGQGPLKI
jgi:four helix bundle protein